MPPVLRYKIVGTDRLLSILERVAFGSEASADAVLEVAAPRVAARSAQLAPRRTGVLAGSIRAEKARVVSDVVYAAVIHWGGFVGRNKSSKINPNPFVRRAVHEMWPEIEAALIDAINRLASHP
jgi:hypothetical protein